MRWSKLRTLIIERFAEPLHGRLDIHSTAYGNCGCGHAWLTWDGEVIANFCTRAHYLADHGRLSDPQQTYRDAAGNRYKDQLTVYGERSRQQVYQALWDFVHTLPIEDALASDDMLLQALAVVDTRIGKRRLAGIELDKMHPLVAYLLTLRMRPDTPIMAIEFIAMRESEREREAA